MILINNNLELVRCYCLCKVVLSLLHVDRGGGGRELFEVALSLFLSKVLSKFGQFICLNWRCYDCLIKMNVVLFSYSVVLSI